MTGLPPQPIATFDNPNTKSTKSNQKQLKINTKVQNNLKSTQTPLENPSQTQFKINPKQNQLKIKPKIHRKSTQN